MPQRLPNAPESRVLLALYHKGPLTRNQLANLEAIPLQATGALQGLVEKTLITLADGKAYRLTEAGHDLCELCLKYDLMIETHYHSSDILSRQIARQNQARARNVLEAEFREVHEPPGATVVAIANSVEPQAVTPEPLSKEPPPPPPAPPAPAPVPSPPTPIPPPVAAKPVVKPIRLPFRAEIPPPRIYSSSVLRRK